MQHKFFVRSVAGLGLAAMALFAVFLAAQAQTGTAGQGLSISPFVLERQMSRGQTLHETIEVTNTTNRTLPVDISVKDFAADGTTGQQTFFDPGQGDQTYSLARWITINNSPKLVLAAGEKTQVDFSITPPANAEDGGHYGAVIFSFQGAPVQGSAVQVSQKIGAIILVKLGKVNEDGLISSFKTQHAIYNAPLVTFVTRFHNTGNVHVKPRGGIGIYNMFGKKIATVLVNENANNVLPNSARDFESTWQDKFAFGPYTAKAELVFGDSGTIVRAETSFWVLPWKLILGVALGLIIVIFLFSYGIRRYNRWFAGRLMESQRRRKR
jgi:hypothetical protein